jgi:hypothetical protein
VTATKAQVEAAVWHEQSAVWEIIAGEIVLQHRTPLAQDPEGLVRVARKRALDAHERLRSRDLDAAGHALIGCAVALGLAARTDPAVESRIDHFGADLGAAVSWSSAVPGHGDLDELLQGLDSRRDGQHGAPTLWELAVLAGSHAGGLSSHIKRRRQRRDIVAGPT